MPDPRRTSCVQAFVIVLLLSGGFVSAQSGQWAISLPRETDIFEIGDVTINGLPTHLQGFVSPMKPAQLTTWFHRTLGGALVENKLGASLVLGQARGRHYLTVQLEPFRTGARGVVAIADLKAAYQRRSETDGAIEHWRSRLPSGSGSIRRMTSEDGGKSAEYLLAINDHGADLNLDRIKSLMRADGFSLQRQVSIDGKGASRSVGEILMFKGQDREAIAVIYSSAGVGTAIVVNTVTTMERLK
ncbi:hypothetical protein GALL_192100 [mine drainage metagenome]|uniref:Uncharacterized protein n=1 Tax=mine drainage metagenome TaxID=410659 RepID=A0A1J5SET2_9ZZZZ